MKTKYAKLLFAFLLSPLLSHAQGLGSIVRTSTRPKWGADSLCQAGGLARGNGIFTYGNRRCGRPVCNSIA